MASTRDACSSSRAESAHGDDLPRIARRTGRVGKVTIVLEHPTGYRIPGASSGGGPAIHPKCWATAKNAITTTTRIMAIRVDFLLIISRLAVAAWTPSACALSVGVAALESRWLVTGGLHISTLQDFRLLF